MTPELTALTLAAILQIVQFILFALPANLELGTRYTGGSRDYAPDKPMSKRTARLQRALNNHFEGLILFGIAATVITVSDQSSTLTAACAYAYLIARILYIPAYAYGLNPWRSVIWAVGFMSTLIMLMVALF
ncbi:putative MAPEG superfamily protein [Roseinatronobacter thiooxidans]|uniref:Putative MAPEG superfamily protein n=1 Tax=Roseinatronobacter thiooxidans TaxID=121821 RepID=A0A2W7PSS0_9RHOB|nr:MAPEG family protein [Roseinatronobacter thiooxidans]PZX39354.1 putative MAPEG superfamily protein [Roseinatronobacter thiooxidans]